LKRKASAKETKKWFGHWPRIPDSGSGDIGSKKLFIGKLGEKSFTKN
jgi:hypothetical protein